MWCTLIMFDYLIDRYMTAYLHVWPLSGRIYSAVWVPLVCRKLCTNGLWTSSTWVVLSTVLWSLWYPFAVELLMNSQVGCSQVWLAVAVEELRQGMTVATIMLLYLLVKTVRYSRNSCVLSLLHFIFPIVRFSPWNGNGNGNDCLFVSCTLSIHCE